jgi:dipeptidyl aminopeptidase/acylaminoacyl peptidase
MAERFDLQKLALEGDAFPVSGGIEQVTPSANAVFAVSANGGVLSYQAENRTSGQLAWFSRTGVNLGSIGPTGQYTDPRLSPDGKRVAVVVPDKESGNRDIWLMELGNGQSTRFTFNPANDWAPVWSPDGAWIAFASDRTAPSGIYRKGVNRIGDEEVLVARSDGGAFPRDWSAGGLLFNLNVGATDTLWILASSGKPAARFSLQPDPLAGGRYSPDGKWVAYPSVESGVEEIYVIPVGGGAKVRVSTAGGTNPTWPSGGHELFYVAPGGVLMSAATKIGATFEAGAPQPMFRLCGGVQYLRAANTFYDVAPDGNRFLVSCLPPEAKQRSISVLIEWQRTIKGMQP